MCATSETDATASQENTQPGNESFVKKKINLYNYWQIFSDHLPSVPKCAMNLHFVGAFSADWNGCSYKTLKTCSKGKFVGIMLYYQITFVSIFKFYTT